MPEMRFLVRWPDGISETCYSPSLVIKDYFREGETYTLADFVARSREALTIASDRVKAKYGYACSLALRQLAEHAQAAGWDAFTPAAATQVRVRHQPPYVLTDDEVRRLFTAIDSQPMSSYSNKAMVDPVLFRVLYGAGLRVSEALSLTLADTDTRSGILRIRDSKNGESRTVPVTARLTATLEGYIAAAHPAPETSDHVFYSAAPGRPINQSTVYLRFRGYLADAGIPHFTGGPHPHSLRHGFAVANLRRWAGQGADLAVMLPYLACYMGHADLRGTQYYLRLTADAYPEVMARAQVRFGYVIPAPPGDEP